MSPQREDKNEVFNLPLENANNFVKLYNAMKVIQLKRSLEYLFDI